MDALRCLQVAVQQAVVDPRNHDVLAIVKAARNGAVYGARTRFPHALVWVIPNFHTLLAFTRFLMTFLYGSGSVLEKLKVVFSLARIHARSLASFAILYKIGMLLLRQCGPTPGKEGPYDTFLAGLVGGYVVFGSRARRTGRVPAVNQQIVIYVFARVVLALARLTVRPDVGLPGLSRKPAAAVLSRHGWSVFAALSWASVMYLFRWHAEELQPGLRSSMDFIYRQSDRWDSVRNLILQNE